VSEPAVVRAVVDTNLLVRGILRRRPDSKAVQLYEAIRGRRFRLVTSEYVLDEVRRTLQRPDVGAIASVSEAAIARVLQGLRRTAHYVPGDFEVELVPRDPKDNPIVACALEGDAGYVVTDDRKHLLPLKIVRVAGYRPVRIVSPSLFLDLLRRATA